MNSGLRPQEEGDIFALDIGTRNVVGMLCRQVGEVFRVEAHVSMCHKSRSMSDGQIEDISRTAETISAVRTELSRVTGIDLTRAAIAAAGRALVTVRHTSEREVDPSEPISDGEIRSLELEAAAAAAEGLPEGKGFFCVGHSVIRYCLDDYPIKNLSGHKGNRISADVLAAFLPETVVNGLNSAIDMCGLEPESMTLEPIAAMNLVIPPELRLINIALADIGAGTSDIAVSKDGSIFGYAMSTTAGDEITEQIVRAYLVDFDTAEKMKLSENEKIAYTDILGFEHTVSRQELYDSISESIHTLAASIAEEIRNTNGQTPAAVFLVGGGSLLDGLDVMIADELGLPHDKVAVGGRNIKRNVEIDGSDKIDPLLITPIGIGITAGGRMGYDLSSVTLNGRRIRIFDTNTLTCAELLMQSGYKANEIIARTGRGLVYTLNGERRHMRGTAGTPSQIAVNGHNVSMDYVVKPGDEILFIPAAEGTSPVVTAGELSVNSLRVHVNGREYSAGGVVCANGREVSSDYRVQMNDDITVYTVSTAEELIEELVQRGVIDDADLLDISVSGVHADPDTRLADGDDIVIGHRNAEENAAEETAEDISQDTEDVPDEAPADVPEVQDRDVIVMLNTKPVRLAGGKEHLFIELMSYADIDTKALPRGAEVYLLLNGKDAKFSDPLSDGDIVEVGWRMARYRKDV